MALYRWAVFTSCSLSIAEIIIQLKKKMDSVSNIRLEHSSHTNNSFFVCISITNVLAYHTMHPFSSVVCFVWLLPSWRLYLFLLPCFWDCDEDYHIINLESFISCHTLQFILYRRYWCWCPTVIIKQLPVIKLRKRHAHTLRVQRAFTAKVSVLETPNRLQHSHAAFFFTSSSSSSSSANGEIP